VSSKQKFKFVDASATVADEEIKFSIGGLQRLNWWNNRHLPDTIDLSNLEKVKKTKEKGIGKLKLKTENYTYDVSFRGNKITSLLGYQGEEGAEELVEKLTSNLEHVEQETVQDTKSEMERAEPPIGKSVTKERIEKFEEILEKSEKVHYIVKEINIIFPTWYAFTDKRMIVKENKLIGTEDTTIAYKNVLSTKLSTSLIDRALNISTKAGNYEIMIAKGNTGKEELRNLVEYLNEKTSSDDPGMQESDNEKSSNKDSKERLEDLKELHAKGVISDEEFEEKKQDILGEL
jgi:hypothetical protein